jgi:NAD+ kinase
VTAQPEPIRAPVRRAAVVTHGEPETIGDALARLERVAADAGVELAGADCADPDVVVVLGGDGTMLRALRGCLERPAPVFGVNFGRVGFLTSLAGTELETGLARVFRGEFRVIHLCTLAAEVGGARHVAVNDIVVTSSHPGRMVELGWEIGGEDLGRMPCDGMICATPTGSTAYNLSNGGPVMMWGLEAVAITFVAPHALDARPLVLPRGLDLRVRNLTRDVEVSVLVDGHPVDRLPAGEVATVGLGAESTLLALLPEVTFFRRYHETFA